jgi:hypothetical protein
MRKYDLVRPSISGSQNRIRYNIVASQYSGTILMIRRNKNVRDDMLLSFVTKHITKPLITKKTSMPQSPKSRARLDGQAKVGILTDVWKSATDIAATPRKYCMLTTSALFAVGRLFIKRLECWPTMRPRANAIRASGFKAVGSPLNPNARASPA